MVCTANHRKLNEREGKECCVGKEVASRKDSNAAGVVFERREKVYQGMRGHENECIYEIYSTPRGSNLALPDFDIHDSVDQTWIVEAFRGDNSDPI